MRLKKGSLVEVLNKSEDPAGSWWCSEIVSGNGRNYYVRYDRNILDVGASLERVPRRDIRPCPPSERDRLDWVPGDIVEVLINFTWMLAKIIMFYGGKNYYVRLLTSSTELIVPSSDIRVQKCWQDNKWIILEKNSAKCCAKITNGSSKEKFISKVPQPIDDHFEAKRNMSVEDNAMIFPMNMKKRARTCSQPLENCAGSSKRMRAIENEGIRQGAFARNSTGGKVGAVASTQALFGEKYMHSSLINKRNIETFETNQVVQIANADGGCCSRPMLEGADAGSISSSSIGSCGVNKSPCRSTFDPANGNAQDMESHYACSEAPANLEQETAPTTDKASHQGFHSLELLAYRHTLVAFYASKFFSWEHEEMLKNLRLMLHISYDEHLAELDNYI